MGGTSTMLIEIQLVLLQVRSNIGDSWRILFSWMYSQFQHTADDGRCIPADRNESQCVCSWTSYTSERVITVISAKLPPFGSFFIFLNFWLCSGNECLRLRTAIKIFCQLECSCNRAILYIRLFHLKCQQVRTKELSMSDIRSATAHVPDRKWTIIFWKNTYATCSVRMRKVGSWTSLNDISLLR